MNLTPQVLLVLSVVMIHDAAADLSDAALVDQLYGRFVDGKYQEAVTQTFELKNNSKGAIITNVVNRLLANSRRNTMEYVNKLWHSSVCRGHYYTSSFKGKDIVKQYFPIEFKMIFNHDRIRLINKRDGKAVKLGWSTDSINDRRAYGDRNDKTSDRMSWQFFASWGNDRVFFRIWNTKHGQNLKLENAIDDVGEHRAWGDDKFSSHRHQWYLQPVKYKNNVLFFIYNREFGHALKLGRYVDPDGDRILWGHNGVVEDNPGHYGWFIKSFD